MSMPVNQSTNQFLFKKRYVISGRVLEFPEDLQFLCKRQKNDCGAEKNIFGWRCIGIYESNLVPRRQVENTIKHTWL